MGKKPLATFATLQHLSQMFLSGMERILPVHDACAGTEFRFVPKLGAGHGSALRAC